ncbi:hypothetical protein TWF225_010763 [Orbilia oligospora]|uniref:Uncharacterized protein n=1 Tax=Orbilia oligospora TaxID=2813651 RepID=A0A8H2E9P2_ORBOL|nr:hypothetical protein TWF225_010763 [Orbilia oligospora]KAF3242538.1 hypothetical protein TWF128_010502 [Orbilia oligospora]KAF3253625.1 hypothetical protein TWF217_007409 [Orbilia oligospora]KAF3286536.1 hypothetical protein TWF132_008818 [Orbilia oligospora]TGJ72906.1 hypothetical protein EYR41_000032 [Orbilia oligospora]
MWSSDEISGSISPAFALSTPDQEISWNIRWKVHKHGRGLLWSKLFSAVSSALPGPEKLNGTRNCPTARLQNSNPKIGPSRDNTIEGQANPHAYYNCTGISRILCIDVYYVAIRTRLRKTFLDVGPHTLSPCYFHLLSDGKLACQCFRRSSILQSRLN